MQTKTKRGETMNVESLILRSVPSLLSSVSGSDWGEFKPPLEAHSHPLSLPPPSPSFAFFLTPSPFLYELRPGCWVTGSFWGSSYKAYRTQATWKGIHLHEKEQPDVTPGRVGISVPAPFYEGQGHGHKQLRLFHTRDFCYSIFTAGLDHRQH